MTSSNTTLPIADGTTMNAFIARPERGGTGGGVMVLQEAFGVNSHIRDVAQRLAREGYVAIAPELFHRTTPPGFEAEYGDFPSVMPHMQAMTTGQTAEDLRAAYEWLQNDAGVAAGDVMAVGFCMGGRVAFLANSVLPLRAAASFYGGRIAPGLLDRTASLHAPMLFFWGEEDHHIPPEQRAAVIAAMKQHGKKYVNVEFSDAAHGFFCDQRPSYKPRAAQQAWALLLEFLRTAK